MIYTVIIDGQSFDLPKKTMKVVEEMDKVAKIDTVKGLSIREKFRALFDFIKNLVGKENAIEILGSDSLEEVDLSEVTLTFKKIMDAYDKPLEDYAAEKSFKALDKLPVDKIMSLVQASEHIAEKGSK